MLKVCKSNANVEKADSFSLSFHLSSPLVGSESVRLLLIAMYFLQ